MNNGQSKKKACEKYGITVRKYDYLCDKLDNSRCCNARRPESYVSNNKLSDRHYDKKKKKINGGYTNLSLIDNSGQEILHTTFSENDNNNNNKKVVKQNEDNIDSNKNNARSNNQLNDEVFIKNGGYSEIVFIDKTGSEINRKSLHTEKIYNKKIKNIDSDDNEKKINTEKYKLKNNNLSEKNYTDEEYIKKKKKEENKKKESHIELSKYLNNSANMLNDYKKNNTVNELM